MEFVEAIFIAFTKVVIFIIAFEIGAVIGAQKGE